MTASDHNGAEAWPEPPPSRDPTLVDLWIDGRVERVPPRVLAHFRYLHQELANISATASRLRQQLQERPPFGRRQAGA